MTIDAVVPSVTFNNGETIDGDLLIAADSVPNVLPKEASPIFPSRMAEVKSVIRRSILEKSHDTTLLVNEVAYRMLVPREKMMAIPELAELISRPEITLWVGPETGITANPFCCGEQYNVVSYRSGVAEPGI